MANATVPNPSPLKIVFTILLFPVLMLGCAAVLLFWMIPHDLITTFVGNKTLGTKFKPRLVAW